MTVEEFAEKLSAYVEEIVINHQNYNWKNKLYEKIFFLIKEHLRKKPSFFVIDESLHNFNLPQTVDFGVQVDTINNKKIETFENFNDEWILDDIYYGKLKHRELESKFGSNRAVEIRRKYVEKSVMTNLSKLPYQNYDFSLVNGACCENIIGYVPIPTGVVGPLNINDETMFVPMSTTEGALIASTNRGCKALNKSGGVSSVVFDDGMSRAPTLQFCDIKESIACLKWLKEEENFKLLQNKFGETTNFGYLTSIEPTIDGRLLHIRFVATTGDAMGMNMVTKGVSEAINFILKKFSNASLVTISGNMCVDKKASAVNWIKGRGKSVCAEATISSLVVKNILKTDVDKMISLGSAKLQNGALNSVAIGGANAHAANVVAAIFLATGQDAAQVVSSSMCSTNLTKTENGDLNITCTMKCLEVGTVGGGTILEPQKACLKMLGCQEKINEEKIKPGDNAKRLASIICATVLAGELSLLASQCTGDLVRSHLRLNRSKKNILLKTVNSSNFLTIPESNSNILHSKEYLNKNLLDDNKRFLTISSCPTLAPLSKFSTNKNYFTNDANNHTSKVLKKVLAKCDQSFI